MSELARRRELVAWLDDRRLAGRHGFWRGNGIPGAHFVGKDLLNTATLLLGHLIVARVKEFLLWGEIMVIKADDMEKQLKVLS